jgi:general secretion pathway protein C
MRAFASLRDRFVLPPAVGALACVALISGVTYWGAQWLTPLPGVPAIDPTPPVSDQTASAVARWLTPGEESLDIVVAGVMVSRSAAAAMLSVNGGPPRAYVAGDRLGHATTLREIEARGIVVDRAGTVERLAVPALSALDEGFIVRVAR